MNTAKQTPAMTPQQAEFTQTKSPVSLYKKLAVGNASFLHFIHYEFVTTIFANLPGLLGLGSRALLYPTLLKSCASAPGFGRGVILRLPKNISLGRKVLLDDYSVLDVRGDDSAIEISDHVTIGRFSTIAAKHGKIFLSSGVNIGSYCRIATNSLVEIDESTLIGAYAYIGPGNHQRGDEDSPLIERPMDIKGGVKIGKNCWIGARATILDGVTIGDGAIVGAHSLVKDDVPAGATVAGTPARVIS